MTDGHNMISVRINPNSAASMLVELSEDGMKDIPATKQKMQTTCRAVTKEMVGMEKDFLMLTVDEILDEPMKNLENLLAMVLCFMCISTLISVLGMFAMSISYTEQQSKQIALRKVMGATVMNASWHLARPFLILSLLAAMLSLPLILKGTEIYLELFPNRISSTWWAIVIAVLLTLLLALVSIAWQTLKVARRNPVESIRRE
jgi:ABC-type antimicrobial peptide transport system permease subunit